MGTLGVVGQRYGTSVCGLDRRSLSQDLHAAQLVAPRNDFKVRGHRRDPHRKAQNSQRITTTNRSLAAAPAQVGAFEALRRCSPGTWRLASPAHNRAPPRCLVDCVRSPRRPAAVQVLYFQDCRTSSHNERGTGGDDRTTPIEAAPTRRMTYLLAGWGVAGAASSPCVSARTETTYSRSSDP